MRAFVAAGQRKECKRGRVRATVCGRAIPRIRHFARSTTIAACVTKPAGGEVPRKRKSPEEGHGGDRRERHVAGDNGWSGSRQGEVERGSRAHAYAARDVVKRGPSLLSSRGALRGGMVVVGSRG